MSTTPTPDAAVTPAPAVPAVPTDGDGAQEAVGTTDAHVVTLRRRR